MFLLLQATRTIYTPQFELCLLCPAQVSSSRKPVVVSPLPTTSALKGPGGWKYSEKFATDFALRLSQSRGPRILSPALHFGGHSELARRSSLSTGCPLIVSCGGTSTELISGFTLVTNFEGNRSHPIYKFITFVRPSVTELGSVTEG